MRIMYTKFLTKNNISAMFLLYVYFLILLLNMALIIVPTYAHTGLSFHIHYNNLCASIFYLFFISSMALSFTDMTSRFLLCIFMITVIIPMLVLYSSNNASSSFHSFMLMNVICFSVTSLFARINAMPKCTYIKYDIGTLMLILFAIFTLIDIFRFIYINGTSMFNLDITKVYLYRHQLGENMRGIFAYFDSWVMQIFNPFCITWSLYKKNRICFIVFMAFQIILFGLSSHKSVLFSGMVICGMYFLWPYLAKSSRNIIKIFIFINVVPLIIYLSRIHNNFCDVVIGLYQRVFILPSQINFWYYEFFSKNGFDWFRQSFLRHFFSSKYDLVLPKVIGEHYYGTAMTNANTGFLASGYAQGGFLVMLIYAVIVGLIISIVASLARVMSPRFSLVFITLPLFFLFTSTDLPLSLLTGGIGWAIFIMYLMLRYNRNTREK